VQSVCVSTSGYVFFGLLVRQTWYKSTGLKLLQALTGPISRGDVGTLRAHLNCLSALDRSEAMDVYCSLGKAAARLAERHSMPITTNQANEIRGMIDAARQAIRPEKMDQ
jgi:predicted short-subunit dehydrogenase-like oxidoreductase (DUF2520 family)